MAELTEEKVQKRAKDLFNKGLVALERGNLDGAIDAFFQTVEVEPRYLKARKYLRMAEIQRTRQGDGKRSGGFLGAMSSVGGMPAYMKTLTLLRTNKTAEALVAAENLLRNDVLNVKFIKAFAQAAAAADLPEAAAQTLDMVKDLVEEDVEVFELLGDMFTKMNDQKSARDCYEKVNELVPNNPAYMKKYKDALAMHSLNKDGWSETADKGGTFRDNIRDKKEAQSLEKENKAVTSAGDAEVLIAEARDKVAREPQNMNYQRSLARLLVQNKRFEEAVAVLTQAQQLTSGDPEIERALTMARVQHYEQRIAALNEAGKTEDAQALELERAQFVFDDLQDRVRRYPQDLKLRYELGVILFENDYQNEAIQQFQMSQRSPNHRIKSLYYLGLCLKQKRQYDMAVQQFETAMNELPTMDDMKKTLCYELGLAAEAMGDRTKAQVYFKQIYQVDIGFRDVAKKVEEEYAN